MKWESAYWSCHHCSTEGVTRPLTVTLDLGNPLEMVEGHMRIPVLYALGCFPCKFIMTSRLMIINPLTDDTEIGDLGKGGKNL